MPAASRVDDAQWSTSEQALLLSQSSDVPPSPLKRRPVPTIVTARIRSTPSCIASHIAVALTACRASVVRRKWSSGLLCAALLLLLVVFYPCLSVADSHGRRQLLAARYVAVHKLLFNIHAALAWGSTWLFLSMGSSLQACKLDSGTEAELGLGAQQSSRRFSAVHVVDSEDGQSYELSDAAPSVFSPSYRPSPSSPYSRPRILACSTSSLRCDVALVDLFQSDLQAEMSNNQSNSASTSSSPPTFCTTPTADASAAASCQQWPFSHISGRRSTSASTTDDSSGCGSGVINIQEPLHWWYYRHPMSCMQLARSIDSRHGYCVGHDPHVDEQRVNFHVAMFGPVWRRQATLAVSAFLLTQNLTQSRLVVWTDRLWSEIKGDGEVQLLLSAAAQHVEVRVWNAYDELIASNSLLSASAAWYASIDDSQGYLRGDLMRLLLLHNYGGVWVDADVLLLRDFAPILGQQFVYKWGSHCNELNGAVMRMFKGSVLSSRFLDAIYHTPPRPNSVDWGNSLYSFMHAAQQASLAEQPAAQPSTASLRSERFSVLPACFFNANWMEPAAFSPIKRPELPQMWPTLWYGPFAYHLHGEVWNDNGFAARDPTYQHVVARITELTRATWLSGEQNIAGAAVGG